MNSRTEMLQEFLVAEPKGVDSIKVTFRTLFDQRKYDASAIKEMVDVLWEKSEQCYKIGLLRYHELYENLYYITAEYAITNFKTQIFEKPKEKIIKWVWVSVLVNRQNFKDGCDCTAGGLTSQVDNADLYCDCTREEAIEHCRKRGKDPDKQLILIRRQMFGSNADYVEPLTKPEGKWNMFGGNYVVTSDSRYREFTGSNRPLPVFDRFES